MKELYKINGRVIHGESRGKALGFPTANIRLHKKIPEGVYAGSVMINSKMYYASTFVGSAETFMQTAKRVESYLFDFDKDLYGKWITVKLYEMVRGNKKFDSVDELVEQMKKDVQEIKEFFATKSY